MWVVEESGLTNTEFLDDVQRFTEPFPLSIWRCDIAVDQGIVSLPLFPDAVRIEPIKIKQQPYITVYDIHTSQAQLEIAGNNGLAILTPTMCDDSEDLCGGWTLEMEHPIDPEQRWTLLQTGNLIRAGGQLFTIKTADDAYDGGTGKITVVAEHIFYQLNDEWIFAWAWGVVDITSKNGADALDQIWSHLTEKVIIPDGMRYSFRHSSDMIGEQAYDTPYILHMDDGGCTPVDLILGERGIIAAKGGELHRDNFYFSVNKRKETARDNAFDIRIGKNLKGIRRTVDTSTMCTYYRLIDEETGMWQTIGWDTAVPGYGSFIPHNVVRSEQVHFSGWIEQRFDQINQEAQARYARNCMPQISYDIDLEDVRDNPDFSITADESIRCGDMGFVYDVRLGSKIGLEITGTVYDRITGRCKKITVGNQRSFVYHPNAPIIWDADGEPIRPEVKEYVLWVQDSTGRYLYDKNGTKIIIEKE